MSNFGCEQYEEIINNTKRKSKVAMLNIKNYATSRPRKLLQESSLQIFKGPELDLEGFKIF